MFSRTKIRKLEVKERYLEAVLVLYQHQAHLGIYVDKTVIMYTVVGNCLLAFTK